MLLLLAVDDPLEELDTLLYCLPEERMRPSASPVPVRRIDSASKRRPASLLSRQSQARISASRKVRVSCFALPRQPATHWANAWSAS